MRSSVHLVVGQQARQQCFGYVVFLGAHCACGQAGLRRRWIDRLHKNLHTLFLMALMHPRGGVTDELANLLGGTGRALREAAHFACHHSKPAPLLARTGRLHRSIERQNVGLEGNAVDKHLYKARHLIENFFARLKQYRCIATRYDKTAQAFLEVFTWLQPSYGSIDDRP